MKLTTVHKPNWQGCIEVVIDRSTLDLENKSSNCNLGWKLTSFSKDIKKKKEFWPIQFPFLVAISLEILILSCLSEKAWALTIQTTYKFGLV